MTCKFWAAAGTLALALSSGLGDGVAAAPKPDPQIQGADLRIEFDHNLRSRVVARFDNKETTMGPFTASESVTAADKTWTEFPLTSQKHERVNDAYGKSERLTVTGKSGTLTKAVSVTMYDEFPAMAFFDVQYTNTGTTNLAIESWSNNAYTLNALPNVGHPAFWSCQSGSYEKRPNWIVPLQGNFHQENFLGMNASDYRGGTPVFDVWRRDIGLAVGHVEPRPRLVSLLLSMPDADHASIAVVFRHETSLEPGESFHTFRTFAAVHQGDYFRTLTDYRRFMIKQGFKMASAPDSAFGAIWCGWGYGRSVQPQQVYDTLPTVKRLGFSWVTLDDGWQNNVGDWVLDRKKFPHGDADMKALVDRIHQEGFRAQLWWSPLSGVPDSELLRIIPTMYC